jgi:acid phosphatase family membrane protein YuiD
VRDLARHVREAHEKVRAHSCHICGKTFVTANNLHTHVRTTHEGKMETCTVCSAQAGLPSSQSALLSTLLG